MNFSKDWRFWLLAFFIIISIFVLTFRGVQFGMDFKGGTLFTLEFSKKITDQEQKVRITNTVSQRLDWTGLSDTSVNFYGDEFVLVQLAETNPDTVVRIESLLKKQGNFEATIDGNVIFTGNDIIGITRDPNKGYGYRKEDDSVRWYLPFVLKSGTPTSGAEKFRDLTFHRCTLVSFDQSSGRKYECDMTYFFIDRPIDSVLVMPSDLYNSDKELLITGSQKHGLQGNLKIDEIIMNGASPVIKFDGNFSQEQLDSLKEFKKTRGTAVVPDDTNEVVLGQLKQIGFEIKEVSKIPDSPWIWDALGVKSAISLSEDVAHMEVATKEQAQILTNLQITGIASDFKTAEERLSDLDIILSSGSLPVSVKSISKESISPLLGENFFSTVIWIGLFAIIAVCLVVFIRYRVPKITGLLIFMIIVETMITIALSSLVSKFDLGAVAGIIAAVGTGIDTEIIIVDELLKGQTTEEVASLLTRIKRALFIVFAAAAISLATMLPIILFGGDLGKLRGFAITTAIGVLVGVLVTRPAFAELAKGVVEHSKQKHIAE